MSTYVDTILRTATFNASCVVARSLRSTADDICNSALHITHELNMASAYKK